MFHYLNFCKGEEPGSRLTADTPTKLPCIMVETHKPTA